MYFHDLTGVLDKKKFSIFGEVKADKKKVTKNLKDSDDGLGADLKQWMQGLLLIHRVLSVLQMRVMYPI